jgi:hypothetical protein
MALKWDSTQTDYSSMTHRPYRRLNVPDAEIIKRYAAGESENAIAKSLGVNRWTIRLRLIESGAHIRSQSESEALKWSRMSAKQRARQVSEANIASRGRVRSIAEKVASAKTRQDRQTHVSPAERQFADMLDGLGIETIPQQALGPYNCDLGAYPVAVEIFGGHWHFGGEHLARTPERLRYFFDAGWHMLMIHVTKRHPIARGAAEYLVSFLKEARRNPSMPRQYRMIRGTGEFIVAGGIDGDNLSLVMPFRSGRDPTNGRYKRVAR